jgi:hypothetical protein
MKLNYNFSKIAKHVLMTFYFMIKVNFLNRLFRSNTMPATYPLSSLLGIGPGIKHLLHFILFYSHFTAWWVCIYVFCFKKKAPFKLIKYKHVLCENNFGPFSRKYFQRRKTMNKNKLKKVVQEKVIFTLALMVSRHLWQQTWELCPWVPEAQFKTLIGWNSL